MFRGSVPSTLSGRLPGSPATSLHSFFVLAMAPVLTSTSKACSSSLPGRSPYRFKHVHQNVWGFSGSNSLYPSIWTRISPYPCSHCIFWLPFYIACVMSRNRGKVGTAGYRWQILTFWKKKKKRIAFHWDKSLDVRASLFQWWTYWGFFSLCCLGLWHQEKLQYKKDTACVLRVITVTGGCAPCGQQGHCVVF